MKYKIGDTFSDSKTKTLVRVLEIAFNVYHCNEYTEKGRLLGNFEYSESILDTLHKTNID